MTLINGLFICLMVFYVIATLIASVVTHMRYKARKAKAIEKRRRIRK
jgi:hypothetical protein